MGSCLDAQGICTALLLTPPAPAPARVTAPTITRKGRDENERAQRPALGQGKTYCTYIQYAGKQTQLKQSETKPSLRLEQAPPTALNVASRLGILLGLAPLLVPLSRRDLSGQDARH
jgi:hypothetical protein